MRPVRAEEMNAAVAATRHGSEQTAREQDQVGRRSDATVVSAHERAHPEHPGAAAAPDDAMPRRLAQPRLEGRQIWDALNEQDRGHADSSRWDARAAAPDACEIGCGRPGTLE